MSKKPKVKKLGVKALLTLMGVDPNETVPSGLREAEFHREMEGGAEERVALERCSASGKVCFTSESQAKAASKRRLLKGSNVSKLRTYHCPDCRLWHFSSSFRS